MAQKSFSGECDLAMRDLIATVAGPRSWGDTRQSWLARAARKANISYRQVHALWYGEIKDPNHRSARLMRDVADLERVAGQIAQLRASDPEFHSPSIAALLDVARALHALDRAPGAQQGDAAGIPQDD